MAERTNSESTARSLSRMLCCFKNPDQEQQKEETITVDVLTQHRGRNTTQPLALVHINHENSRDNRKGKGRESTSDAKKYSYQMLQDNTIAVVPQPLPPGCSNPRPPPFLGYPGISHEQLEYRTKFRREMYELKVKAINDKRRARLQAKQLEYESLAKYNERRKQIIRKRRQLKLLNQQQEDTHTLINTISSCLRLK